LSELTDNLRKNNPVDWTTWKNREIKNLCRFFVEKKFCKQMQTEILQYTIFEHKVDDIYRDKENVLTTMIKASPGLRDYLQLYSIFTKDDWLNKEMSKILEITKEDVEKYEKAEFVPPEILEKLSMFDPEPIAFEKEPIRIEYDFWGFGGPIKIIDTDWERIDKEVVHVEQFLSQYKNISTDNIPSSYTERELAELDDGLPF